MLRSGCYWGWGRWRCESEELRESCRQIFSAKFLAKYLIRKLEVYTNSVVITETRGDTGYDSGKSFGEEVWNFKGSEGRRFGSDFIFRMNYRY